jgi:hypothetical protein
MTIHELAPPEQLMKFIVGKWISKPIYVVAELGIADILAEGSKSIDELAQTSQSHAPSLYRVMRALASVGIFCETEGRRFELTPMAECLQTGAMRSLALMFDSDWSDKAWGYFLDSVRTGDTAFEKAHGMPVSDWLEKNPHAATIFNEANAVKAARTHRAIVDVYDFAGIKTLTDVGGGLGVLMAEILMANPSMHGVVADIPSVVQEARATIRSRGLEGRCQVVECDFFKQIPAGSDGYLMSHILHDWSVDRCTEILKNFHNAMKPDSKLLIVEMIVPPGNQPSIAKILDLEMLVTTGGKERTESEYKMLLESSGYHLTKIVSIEESVSVIEARQSTDSESPEPAPR